MSPKSVSEYLAAIRPRYQRAPKGEKGKLLDEAVQVTGYHRKALVRLLRGPAAPVPHARRGRPRRYGVDLVAPLVSLWEATGRVCPQRLCPFLPALIDQMQRHQEVHLPAETRRQVLAMSASTIDRLLRPVRHKEGRRPWSTTKPGTLLKQAIPIRTFAQWDDHRPGFLEADLVAHCGESTEGFFLEHADRRGHRDRLGGAPGSVGQEPGPRGGSVARAWPAAALPLARPGLGQWG